MTHTFLPGTLTKIMTGVGKRLVHFIMRELRPYFGYESPGMLPEMVQ